MKPSTIREYWGGFTGTTPLFRRVLGMTARSWEESITENHAIMML